MGVAISCIFPFPDEIQQCEIIFEFYGIFCTNIFMLMVYNTEVY